MLRVIGSIKVKDVYLRIDDDVPFSFRCAVVASVQPLYWRTGDIKKSLIQIGLNQDNGAICSVTVTLIDAFTKLSADETITIRYVIEGLPICDIEGWPSDRYKDEPNLFISVVGDDRVSIWFVPKTHLDTVYDVGNLRFGVNANRFLCLLEFRALNRHDIDQIVRLVDGQNKSYVISKSLLK